MRYLVLFILLVVPFVAADDTINYSINNTNISEDIIQNNINNTINFSLSPLLADTVYTGVTYEKLYKVKNENYATGDEPINATVLYWLRTNQTLWNRSFSVMIKSWKTAGTGFVAFNTTGNYTLCAKTIGDAVCQELTVIDPRSESCNVTLSLELKEPQLYYDNGETIQFWNRLHGQGDIPYSIRYWIEDLDGDVKKLTLTENTNQKRWTPRIDEEIGVYLLKNNIELLACNNTNKQTSDAHIIVVKGEQQQKETASHLELQLTQPKNGYTFGGEVKAHITLYKGNETKYAVKAWVENVKGTKVSTIATLHAKKKYTHYDLTLPLVLDQREGSGKHHVVVEGLDLHVEDDIWIKGFEKEEVEEIKQEEEGVIITSFYTRNMQPRQEINLYATVKGEGKVTIELVGLADHEKKELDINGSYKYKTTVAMQEGSNIFVLKITDGKTITQQVLLLEMTDKIRKVEKFSALPVTKEPDEEIKMEEQKTEENNEEKVEHNFLTGNTTYDTNTTTAAVPLLLGIMGALVLGVILHKR